MTRIQHLAIAALALTVCPASVFAHIPRDVLEPPASAFSASLRESTLFPVRVHPRLCVIVIPDASRLTRVQYHNGTSNFVDRVYTLDPHGNTTAMEINTGLLPQVTPQVMRLKQNAADELTTIQTKSNPGVQGWTAKTPVHDDEGNLTSDGDSTFSYDYENRLVAVAEESDSATYYYAGDGSRVAAVTVESGSTNTTVFVLDHADPLRRPLAELDENGALIRRFVWARGVVAQVEANGTVHYFHHDGQGSTLALSDTNNVPTDQWFYSPYGEVMTRTGTTDTPYQWCGGVGVRRVSVGGLYFARHRYYHAGLHRWTARDPAGMAGGANLYTYALNAPWLYYDPWGLCAQSFGSRAWNVTKGVGIIVAGFVPYLGDTMDVYDVAAPGSSGFDRTVGGISLGVNVWTAGLAPNAGPIVRGAGMVGDAFRGVFRGGGRAATEIGQASIRSSDDALFEVIDGVRRSKAGDLVGNQTIPARILREGRVVDTRNVPIESLRSPKAAIDISNDVNADRFFDTLNRTRSGSTPPAILIQEGVRGTPIRDVVLDPLGDL